jgi:hypothetical protein
MNMNMQAKEVYMTIYYDYVDGHPSHFEEVKPVWLDLMQCGTSEVSGRTANAKFDVASSPWVANFEGEVLGTGGHLHDGGTHIDVLVDRKVICVSVPTYGTDEQALIRADVAKAGGIADAAPGKVGGTHSGHSGAQAPAAPMSMSGGGHAHGGLHVIAMSICADNKGGVKDIPISPLGVRQLKKGQSWTLRAYYDYSVHPGMKNNRGGQATVMGISIMYAKTAKKRVA